ncbi:hypothetical protein LWI28_017946 [Acer negundo]|uniref:non-specific serine/threonine protein kinase n=1 Tax=Acer negundo TaxID=4023 RepID=A0AAD5NJY9_ACENE|nr:hypothetical protein LWI28_017946 [Acer negundo]
MYEACKIHQFHCGNIKSGYPFWGKSHQGPQPQPQPWGCTYHPELKLNCEPGDVTTMMINEVNYRVLDIKSKDQTLRIVRMDSLKGLCPGFHNTTINHEIFNYSYGYQNVTFMYDCPSNKNQALPLSHMRCSFSEGVEHRNLSIKEGDHGPGNCNTSVFFPVPKYLLPRVRDDPLDLRQVLNQGFELKWKLGGISCEDCTNSKGTCGWDPDNNKTNCFCPNQPAVDFPNACPAPGNKGLPPAAVGGIAAGSAAVVIFVVVFLLLNIRKRRKIAAQTKTRDLQTAPTINGTTSTTTTTSLSQSIPSYPSSKLDLESGMTSTYFGAHVFSYSELKQATLNFHPSKQLGDGGFGIVYYGELKDGRPVAVKRLYENSLKCVEQFMTEIEILTKLRHLNLVTLYGCTSRHSRELLLVYEYIPNGTVADHLHGRNSNSVLLPWPVRLSIAVETAEALAFLHTSDVIHRDVKTNNILLENNFRVKVADFGLSRLFPTNVTHISTAPQGTPGYVDPEYYQCYKLTDKSDVFSFGVVLIELISSLEAVDTNRHRQDINLANMAINKIQNQALSELVDQSLGFERDYAVRSMVTSVAELAFRCLQQDREIRPSMQEVSFGQHGRELITSWCMPIFLSTVDDGNCCVYQFSGLGLGPFELEAMSTHVKVGSIKKEEVPVADGESAAEKN